MIDIEELIDIAIQRDASDIHLTIGLKPMLRIVRKLVPVEKYEELTEEDMYDVYDALFHNTLLSEDEYSKMYDDIKIYTYKK